ncbi:MAG: alanine racemase [Alphaproteobacteria bacterium]
MSEIIIDTGAIAANYTMLRGMVGAGVRVAGVVKANGYGCGLAAVAEALRDVGCDLFFVATLPEAVELRMIIGDTPEIAALNGYEDTDFAVYRESNIIPVLNHEGAIAAYRARVSDAPLPAILHIDTGMNRLGFAPDAPPISAMCAGLDLRAVMTHFASADEHDNPKSAAQVATFKAAAAAFDGIPQSICNSAGIFGDPAWHADIVRPGMALYGLNPTPHLKNPMKPVVQINASILQIREARAGETCGYNETYRFEENTRVATLSLGYADGFLRSLSNTGKLYWNGIPCPIRGRVSMDTTIVDISAVPENDSPRAGDMMEVIGPHQSADDLASDAGTIGYEILTSLSRRFRRVYV